MDTPPEELPGERQNPVRHPDNLFPEGQMQVRQAEKWAPGERSETVVHSDNLKLEGQMQGKRLEIKIRVASFKLFSQLVKLVSDTY